MEYVILAGFIVLAGLIVLTRGSKGDTGPVGPMGMNGELGLPGECECPRVGPVLVTPPTGSNPSKTYPSSDWKVVNGNLFLKSEFDTWANCGKIRGREDTD